MRNALKGEQEEFIKSLAQPDKRIIDSVFDVYLDQNYLFYVKADCRPADMDAKFFLHMIPADEKYPSELQPSRGFNRDSFKFSKRGFRVGRHGCATMRRLPHPVRYIRTGQYVRDEGILWEGEGWIDPHGVGEERPKFPVVAGTRIIDADFDVYLDGRHLVYHKAECGPADREAPFFLQVTPVDETILQRDRRRSESDNQDDFNNPCTIEQWLPPYAIRHIRTGQHIPGEGVLWEAEFTLDRAGASRGDERVVVPQRTIRSVFDVTLDGRRLIYRKAACRPADREAGFFLHVIPVDETDVQPWRVQHGFDNLDFRHPGAFNVDEFGCTMRRRVLSYPIRRLRTGQYIPDKGPLWEGEFAMAQHALGQD